MADTAIENEKAQPDQQAAPPAEPEAPPPPSNRRFIVIGVILLLVMAAVFFYWRSTFTEDTDDAQVDGNLYQVSSRITGHVIKVYVDDNQTVQAGQRWPRSTPPTTRWRWIRRRRTLRTRRPSTRRRRTNVPITSITSAPM